MNRLRDLLGADFPVLFDGGMGTLLQERGLEGGGAGELWNVEHPDVIRKIHTEYAEAGARVLTTNTFGGTEPRLAMHGLGDRVHELNEAAASIAHEVAQQHGIFVAGDLGPTGELMFPMGTMDEEQAIALFEAQLRGLVAGGIDLIVIETMSDLSEVKAAITAAEKVAPDLPIVVTLSFDTNLHTMMGVAPGAGSLRARGHLGRRRWRQLWTRPRRARVDHDRHGRRPPRRPAADRSVERRPTAPGRRPVRLRRLRGRRRGARRPTARSRDRSHRLVLRLDACLHCGDARRPNCLTMRSSTCPSCGAVLPDASDTPAGPTHPYMTSSPECWAAFGSLLAVQYNDPERMVYHQLLVDAYAVQHPGSDPGDPDPRAVQSVAIHLMTLCLFLEHGADPALGTRLHKAMVKRPSFHPLPAPESLGTLNVTSMPIDGDPASTRAAAYAWARSAWDAWRDHHDVIEDWLVESGLRTHLPPARAPGRRPPRLWPMPTPSPMLSGLPAELALIV